MNKIIFCNITMQEHVEKIGYKSEDGVLSDSHFNVLYPINSFLVDNINTDDSLKIILIYVKDQENRYMNRIKDFKNEFEENHAKKCKDYTYVEIPIPYQYENNYQSGLIKRIVNEISNDSYLMADITYGYKDLPIALLSVFAFAIKHLDCTCEYILYRQVFFKAGKPENPILCNKAPFLHLISVINSLDCSDSDSARKMLALLLE